MLVLGRKPGERIVINENITIYIVSNNDGQLKLGINAPKDVSIVRGELLDEPDDILLKVQA